MFSMLNFRPSKRINETVNIELREFKFHNKHFDHVRKTDAPEHPKEEFKRMTDEPIMVAKPLAQDRLTLSHRKY